MREEITDIVGAHAFRIGDEGFLSLGGDELLVVGARALPQWFPPGVNADAWLDDDDDFD